MKAKYAFILLAVILSITCVSAADNTTEDILSDIDIEVDEVMWQENLTDISVDLPENTTGDFKVEVNDEIIYNKTITNTSFKVPLKLPEDKNEILTGLWPPSDYKIYKINAFLNSDLIFDSEIKVMKYPKNFTYLYFPSEVLKNDESLYLLAFPWSANGDVEYYIDDKLFNKSKAQTFFYLEGSPFSTLSLANHTFKVIYYGDDYYSPFTRTFSFLVTNAVIGIPKTISIGHDDCIWVETDKNIKGNVKVYIDDKLICSKNTEDGQFLMSLEDYIKYTDKEIKIVYSNSKFTRTKTQILNMTYDFDVYIPSCYWGCENIIDIILPDTLNNDLLRVTINGVKYNFTTDPNDGNNVVYINVSDFSKGNYSMNIVYSGDSKYYFLNKTYNFTIDYYINLPYRFAYASSSNVNLKLPNDAAGYLEVYVDGVFYKSSKLSNGYAQINLGDLKPGKFNINAVYNGGDYNVTSQRGTVYVKPKIDFTYGFTAGENQFITLEVPKDCKGYVVFEINGKNYKVNITNGIAKLPLKKLKAGEYDVDINYYGEDGYNDTNWIFLDIYKPKIKVISAFTSFKGVFVKIKLLTKKGKAMANKKVTFKFNGKKYTIKTDKNGIATFKKSQKLKNKKYKLKITSQGAKSTKRLKTKSLHLDYKVKSKKVIFKLTVNKKVKNQIVRFKINSKTYKVKTDAEGIAKIKVKKTNSVKCSVKYNNHNLKIKI